PVAFCVAMTLLPTITAPFGSVTRPLKVAVAACCAAAERTKHNIRPSAAVSRETLRFIGKLPFSEIVVRGTQGPASLRQQRDDLCLIGQDLLLIRPDHSLIGQQGIQLGLIGLNGLLISQ